MEPKIIYVDMDGVLCDFKRGVKERAALEQSVKYPQSKEGFFLNLKPIEKGIETVNRLRSIPFFDVYILTAPSVRNPLCYTEKRLWIENHFDFDMAKKMIISPNKGLNKGHYLIDDYDHGKGQENFEGKLIHFGSDDFKDWDAVLNYFTEHYMKEFDEHSIDRLS